MPIISHVLPLEEFARAFDLLHRGDAIKIILDVAPVAEGERRIEPQMDADARR